MKTIILHVPDEAGEAKVLAALRALQQETPFYLESDFPASGSQPLTAAEVEAEILLARQGQSITLAQARRQFGL